MIVVTSSFSKSSVFKISFPSTRENEKPAFSNSSGLKSVFEKLRFRDGLVWTVGLTVEIKLCFQISPVYYAYYVYYALVSWTKSPVTNLALYSYGSSFSRHFIESLAIFPPPHHPTEHSLYLTGCLHLVLRHKQIHFSGRHTL